ncbi:MAG TPA: NAD(P)/FAD-dependent oxidoreductase [Terriglobales bacterium]|nr:NAD(P)/FAD-dependent oxidoreductase [Terriglobales bacterium]
MSAHASVVGSGPNGLSAAIVLAQAGLDVEVFEAEEVPGGAVRTLELTVPGFRHDFGSAVYPLGAGSPFFSSLPLSDFGLEWIHSPAPLAHPFDDGTAVILERNLQDAERALDEDGKAWSDLLQPFIDDWPAFAREVLRPVPSIPRRPLLLAQFGLKAFLPASAIAHRFNSERTRALFAGLAAHSFLSLNEPLSGAMGMLMAIPAHAVGWPIAGGGAQSLTNALCGYFGRLGGRVKTSKQIASLNQLPDSDLYLCNLTPRQLLKIAGDRLRESYKRILRRFRYSPGAFKVDYALSEPIPWRAQDCRRAATVHLGGSFDEIAASESAARNGEHAERPFILLTQPSLFDPLRAPEGKHTAWAYCHVPNGSTFDMLPRIENQIERFAPGFRECVLARRVFRPIDLEAMDSNLVGGDVAGGVTDIRQFLFRPSWRRYATSAPNIYICSASTPPGGGVHGMCGYHAAKMALSRLKR